MSLVLLALFCLAVGDATAVGWKSPRPIWSVTTGHDWGAHEYIDTEGYIRGFTNELITLICAEAEMDCRIVWDKYSNCWKSAAGQRPYGGVGLMSRWYDACTGWLKTIERIHTFTFSQAYLKPTKSFFYVLQGSSFDVKNLYNKTIGFFDGWASNEQCVARASNIKNNILKKEQIIHIPGPLQGIEMLKSKKIHAFFASGNAFSKEIEDQLRRIEFPIECALGASSMMSRVDSDFPAMWNVGFNKARSNGKFLALCESAQDNHGKFGDINCVDSY